MTTAGDWMVAIGTGLQLISIVVLWRLLHQFIKKLTTQKKPRLAIHSISLTSGELAFLKEKVKGHDNDIRTLQEQVRGLTVQVKHPTRLEITGGVFLAFGTALNLTGAIFLATN